MHAELTTPPEDYVTPVYWTKHLRVCDTVPPGWRLVLDFSHDSWLEAWTARLGSRPFRAATLHPNERLDDFGDFDGSPVFPVVPEDMTRQETVLRSLASRASGRGAQIVVAPELSVDEQVSERLRQALCHDDRMVVAGSYHVVRDGARVNECRLFLGTEPAAAIVHHKFHPLEKPVVEDIDPVAPAIRCIVGGGWQLTVGICRDFLDPDVARSMWMLGCNLVLIPAMSPTLEAFKGFAQSLACYNQAVVIVANNPMLWPKDDGEAIAARAALGHPTPGSLDFPTASRTRPGVAWHDLNEGHVTYQTYKIS